MFLRKLLIADPSDIFCQALINMLGIGYEARMCHNGYDTLEYLENFNPDIVVMDLTLSGFDGISVLKELCARPRRPSIMVTTRFLSDYIELAMDALNVDYVVRKPCNMRALAERIRELEPRTNDSKLSSPEEAAGDLLLELGVCSNLSGYRCLETAVALYEQFPDQSVTKDLYPEIARRCGGNGLSVERAIRTAIHGAWARRDDRTWRQIFPSDRDGTVPRPSNTQFIAAVAECLRRRTWRSVG